MSRVDVILGMRASTSGSLAGRYQRGTTRNLRVNQEMVDDGGSRIPGCILAVLVPLPADNCLLATFRVCVLGC